MSVPVVKVSVLTTPPSLKLKLLPKPVVQVKMLSRFPSNVYALSPVILDRSGGNYTISIDINAIIASLPPSGVASVFGRTGAVVAQSGDYTFAQIGSKPTTLSGYGITDAQPLDADLTAIAALTTTSFGRAFLTLADAAASRTYLSLVPGTDIQAYDSDLAALAANNTNGIWVRTGAGIGAARTITGTANSITVTNGDGVSGNPTLAISTDAALPGNPTTTTQAVDNNTTRVATTAYVVGQAASATPLGNAPTAVVGTSTRFARADHVHPGREVLTSNRTYYVRTDGNDSNNGLANTSGGAFLTIQKAYNTALTLDLSGYAVTIQIADGTYTSGLSITSPLVGGTLTVIGNVTTPDNVLISTSGTSINVSGAGPNINISSLKVASSGSDGILSAGGANVFGTAISYGVCSGAHVRVTTNGTYTPLTSEKWSGNAQGHYLASSGGIVNGNTVAANISTTITFSLATVFCETSAIVNLFGFTFSGSAVTGTRYSINQNAVCNTYSGGAGYFPGSVAGGTATGGQYT